MPRIVVSWQDIAEATVLGKSPLEKGAREGDSPVHWSGIAAVSIALLHLPQSRVVWECSPKRVVNPTQG